MPKPRTAVFLLLMAAAGPQNLSAAFSLPTIDLSSPKISAPSAVAIWSTLDVSISAGAWVSVVFPPDTTVPVKTLASCECLAMKHSLTSTADAKAFIANEVLVTSGAVDAASRAVSFQLPAPVDRGKIYFRFKPGFGILNPTTAGFATLTLVDPDGNSLGSRGYYLSLTYNADIGLAPLAGTVSYSGTTKPASGVLVLASTDGIPGMHPMALAGPGGALSAPRSTTSRAYSTATNFDGSYRMLVPPGTYSLMAVASRVTLVAGVNTLQGVSSSVNTVTMAGSPVSSNIGNFPAFP